MELKAFVLLGFLIEAVVNILVKIYVPDAEKPFIQRIDWKLLLSIVVSEGIAFGLQMDLIRTLGYTAVPWFGIALTGLLLSRGSNFIHDIEQFVVSLKEVTQHTAAITKQSAIAAKRTSG